jgi:hypothetical protein
LEASARSALSVFFALDHAGITGEKPVIPQTHIVFTIVLAQCPRYRVPARPRLAVNAAAIYIDKYIKFLFVRSNQKRLAHYVDVFLLREIRGGLLAVDDNFAPAVAQKHARNRRFPSPGSDSKIFQHPLLALSFILTIFLVPSFL